MTKINGVHRAKVRLPTEIPLTVLSDELDLPPENLPRRMEIAVFCEGKLTKVASLSKEKDTCFVYPAALDKLVLSIEATSSLSCLVINHEGGQVR